MKNIILTGDRPTGRLHLGHYVGSLKRRVELQNSGRFDEINILIADDQALTDNADNPGKIRENIINVVLDYLSVGIDPTKSTICVQSTLPALPALSFYYMNLVTTARLSRNPTGACRWAFSPIPSLRPPISRPSTPTWCLWARISFPCWSRPVRSWRSSTASMARR